MVDEDRATKNKGSECNKLLQELYKLGWANRHSNVATIDCCLKIARDVLCHTESETAITGRVK